jgi:hypothetical protein
MELLNRCLSLLKLLSDRLGIIVGKSWVCWLVLQLILKDSNFFLGLE